MKKNIFEMVVALVNGENVADMDTLRAEVNAEWEHLKIKQSANKNLYEAAREVAFGILNKTPKTAKEIYAKGEGQWPEGFTAGKLQYAILHYWNDQIVKHENGKSAFTYTVK